MLLRHCDDGAHGGDDDDDFSGGADDHRGSDDVSDGAHRGLHRRQRRLNLHPPS